MKIKNYIILILAIIIGFQCKPDRTESYEPQLDLYLKFKLNNELREFYGNEIFRGNEDFTVSSTNQHFTNSNLSWFSFVTKGHFNDIDGKNKKLIFQFTRLDTTSNIQTVLENNIINLGELTFPFKNPDPVVFNFPDSTATSGGTVIDSFIQIHDITFEEPTISFNQFVCDSTTVSDIYFEIVDIQLMKNINLPNFKDIIVYEAKFDLDLCNSNGESISLSDGELKYYIGINPLRK